MGHIADIDNPHDHEGYVAMIFSDGALSSGTSCAHGIYLEGYTYLPTDPSDPSTWGKIDPAFLRPFSDIAGWLPVCVCGWKGVSVDVPNDDDLDELTRRYREPSGHDEELLMSQWQLHIREDVRS